MHKYLVLRGVPELIRRVMYDLRQTYLPFINKKTGRKIGDLQLMPREIKTLEVIFPATEKKNIKKVISDIVNKNCEGMNGGISIHWLPFKKDKFEDGVEII